MWKAYYENPYDELTNPLGVIQMMLAKHQVSVHVHIHILAVNTRKIPLQDVNTHPSCKIQSIS